MNKEIQQLLEMVQQIKYKDSLFTQEKQQDKEMKLLYASSIFQREQENQVAQGQLKIMEEALQRDEFDIVTLSLGLSPFQGDLGIVDHAGESIISPLEKPKEHGEYTLSTNVSQKDVEALKGKKILLIIQCMDKDGAAKTYQEITDHHRGEGLTPVVLSIGGGIAQQNTITRDVAPNLPMEMQVNRSAGLKLALKSIKEIVTQSGGSVDFVYALTHDCRCGACAFYNNDMGVPEENGTHKGSAIEVKKMATKTRRGISTMIEGVFDSETKVKGGVVHFGEDVNNDGNFSRSFESIHYLEQD